MAVADSCANNTTNVPAEVQSRTYQAETSYYAR